MRSPIIAIILMVAITVVLAATIYVWVSGMGKGGTSAPSLSATADNVNDRLVISQADKGLNWSKVTISWSADGSVNLTLYPVGETSAYLTSSSNDSSGSAVGPQRSIQGGDYIAIKKPSTGGATKVTITLTYAPTNTNWGTWTFYL